MTAIIAQVLGAPSPVPLPPLLSDPVTQACGSSWWCRLGYLIGDLIGTYIVGWLLIWAVVIGIVVVAALILVPGSFVAQRLGWIRSRDTRKSLPPNPTTSVTASQEE